MPSLAKLEAEFLKATPDGMRVVKTLRAAQGVWFLCPLCFEKNGGPAGTHHVICWFEGKVPDDRDPKPGRWRPSGTGLKELTFVGPGPHSVQLLDGCRWHGYVKNGSAD